MSNFSFIHDTVLQSNLDKAFEHIVDLLTLSESESYKNKFALVSSLRKTIIIHTASIIEALLLWQLKKLISTKKFEMSDEWKYFNVVILYQANNSLEVIAGKRRKEKKDIDHLDFLRITDICLKNNVLNSEKLRDEIDRVRILRNRLHIGGLVEVEKEYTKKDLEFCFQVADKIKKLVQS